MEQQSSLFGNDPRGGADIFGGSKIPPSAEERGVALLIWQHRGRKNPVSLKELSRLRGLRERELKAIVERLRSDHGLRIGARRKEPAGYFVIEDAEDARVALEPFTRQIFTMLRTFRRLATPAMYCELAGQIRMELEGDDTLSR